MHLLVGKPAMEALVTDIYVEAETHFMVFATKKLAFAIQAFWSETFKVKSHFMAFCKTDRLLQ